jgi:hypothetical protein
MVRGRLSLILTTAALCAAAPLAQMPSPVQLPNFTGSWAPSDPARSDVLFDNGLGWVPGSGRLIIEQRPDRLTVTREMPDNKMDPLLSINGQVNLTVAYRIFQPRGRSGGAGAGGSYAQGSSWQGASLVLSDSGANDRSFTTTYSLDGERLKLERRTVVSDTRQNNTAEWFTRK